MKFHRAPEYTRQEFDAWLKKFRAKRPKSVPDASRVDAYFRHIQSQASRFGVDVIRRAMQLKLANA